MITIDINNAFIEIKDKKKVTDLMRADNVNSAVVVGFAGNTMFYIIQTASKTWSDKKDEYITYEIDEQGSEINVWTESSAIKALGYFKGNETFYVAKKSIMRQLR